MTREAWKPIQDYEGLYEVSNFGRVRSYPRNGTREKDVHIICQSISNRGYCRVSLSKDSHTKNYPAHRLVARAFIPNPDNKPEVNHIDGDPKNNFVGNLEWVTASENHIHRVYKLKHNSLKRCKKVLCVETGEIFPSVREAARVLKRDHKGIVRAISGQYKQSYGYHWQFI